MTAPVIAVLDYDIGNLASIVNALTEVGVTAVPTRDRAQIESADALILPGVGAFCQGMGNLSKYDLLDSISLHISSGKPFLGICLGMQLLFEESEEFGLCKGLGILKGRVRKLTLSSESTDKLPHIGWNAVRQPITGRWGGTIFETVSEPSDFYFVHSFAVEPEDQEIILGVTDFGGYQFCSGVHSGNIYGCQFHPEKSGMVGLSVLRNFVALQNMKG
jgi:imidazole glycerol-phosphate synthase subunit HisH